jgi:hypothetical protein
MSAEVRRVVLALDRDERTARLLREAALVASSLGAELEGLLIEDDALLRLAGHDFARRLGREGLARGFSHADLELEWRAMATQVRRAFEREAERGQVMARLAVTRGTVEGALRDRLAGGDLVVVGWAGWSPPASARRVRVLYEGDVDSERALGLARRLAGTDGELVVWVAPDGARAEELGAMALERLRGAPARIAGLSDAAPATLRRALTDQPGGLLVVPSAHPLAGRLADRSEVARFACSVLLTGGA